MFKMEHVFQMGFKKATKCSTSFPQTRRGKKNCCRSNLWMGHSLESCECIIWGSTRLGCKFAEVHWESVICVGQQPLAISLDAIYIKSSLRRPLLAHCNWFRHVGYDRGPRPTPYYNDKHEQVRFILNTINFKVSILYYFQFAFFQFLVLCTCIEIEVFFQFCFNPPCLSNLIMSSQFWCMTVFASKTSRWFHRSNSRMSSFLMSTRDVKTSPKRCGILWHKRVFFTICMRFNSRPIFPFEFVNYLV